jgi:hypothetical protein
MKWGDPLLAALVAGALLALIALRSPGGHLRVGGKQEDSRLGSF